MNSEKHQIAAVLKELQKHQVQEDARFQREKLIEAIAEATGEKEALVRRKLEEVEVRNEVRQGICVVVVVVGAVVAFAIGFVLLEVTYLH